MKIIGRVNTYERLPFGLRITNVWGRDGYRDVMEVIAAGEGRYGLIHCGTCIGIVPSGHLLAALSDFRRGALIVRDEERARAA